MIRTLLATAASASLLAAAAQAQTYAITNARALMTGTASSPADAEGVTIVVRRGRIEAMGPNVRIPSNAEVIDAAGGYVTPGLFAAVSALGLEEIGLNREGNDRSAEEDVGLSVSFDAADGFYEATTAIPVARAAGVTRAYVAPDPGDDLFGGCGMVVTLSGGDEPIVERCVAQTVSLGYAGAAREGDSRLAAMARLRRALADARAYQDDPDRYAETYEAGRLAAADAAALVPLLTGEQKMLAFVNGASDIKRVLAMAEEYGIDLVIYGAAEAHLVAEEIAAAGVPVVVDPVKNLPYQFEQLGATLEAPAILEAAGVTVAFYDDDIAYTHNLGLLTQLAGNAVANGMSYNGALSAITMGPARIWGQDDRFGLIGPGRTADLVVWDGDPLEVTSNPVAVFIDGEEMSLENRQKALTERYRDLTRGDRPFAYRD
ncbi:amidohydrolase family protein [Parvularcula dongshanensis]|uniref:Imidazolonepropionase-like amidohydrolase n=1 Tax=Parvularcula dongshanensis TaxID=1173995 RepID=A0A840I108_9PROT|nr:amidohydrolase family protein [Parvularcula dongshanensis]MBB4657963.1 imidazolonepropionase-like amidohydrolase [Parvularcula dongshanensis]